MRKEDEIKALIDQGRRAYYRRYRSKPENKAKARQYRENFFLKIGLEQLKAKGDKLSENK